MSYINQDDGFDTKAIHGGYDPCSDTNACAVPIYRTSSYVFNNAEHAANLFALKELGNIYTRLQNPTTSVLEKRIASLENGAAAVAAASGQNANFSAIITLASKGDNIIAGRNLYGGTYTLFEHLLPQMGISVKFIDPTNPEVIDTLVDNKTRAVFIETVSNPALQVTDIKMVAKYAHKYNVPVVVDNTFATPYLCRPIEFGADIVVHSLTKWISGHGTAIGGIVVDSGSFDWSSGRHPLFSEPDGQYHGLTWCKLPEPLRPIAFALRYRTCTLRTLGGCISPDNSWIALQGLETLGLRMERHCSNAFAVARMLQNHPKVNWVRFPGLKDSDQFSLQEVYLKGKGGALVAFELEGGKDAGINFVENLRIFRHLANVGDAKSLVIHPASTTHQQLSEEAQRGAGITPGFIRLAIGIEDPKDICKDLQQALQRVSKEHSKL